MSKKVNPDPESPAEHEVKVKIPFIKMPPQHNWLFLFFEDPHSGDRAKRFADLMTIVVLGSIVVFCLETENVLKESCSYICWTLLDWFFVILFTLEFGIRQFLYIQEGKNKEFWGDPLNVIDFVAILPSYIELFQWIAANYPEYGPEDALILKLMKLLKCTRVFKLMKHFDGTEVLIKSISEAMAALMIPFFFLGIFVLLFASVLYFMEQGRLNEETGEYIINGGATDYPNIPITMYFMMVTMTTTGYGDQYPSTTMGKILVCIAAIFGILFLAMPLTIVGNSFYNNWNKFLAKKEREKARREMLARRREFKRRTLLSSDLSAAVGKLVVKHTAPSAIAKRLDGPQRDVLGSYFELSHIVSNVAQKTKELENFHTKMQTTPKDNETAAAEPIGETATTVIKKDNTLSPQMQEARERLLALQSEIVDMTISGAVLSSVVGRGTKTRGRAGSARLLRDGMRRILVQIKMKKWASMYGRGEDVSMNADIAGKGYRGWKDKLYLLLEFPESSAAAGYISKFSIVVIMLSIFAFCAESVPEFHSADTISEPAWFAIEATFTFIFSVEFILRFVAAPRKCIFWKDTLNLMDFVAIIPFFIELILSVAASTVPWNFKVDNEEIGTALRLVKLFRVLRVFKMTRQFPSSRLILDTFIFSVDALTVPIFFLVVFVLIFASMLYFLESGTWVDPTGAPCEFYCPDGTYVYEDGSENPNNSIFTCFWLMIITITTVGYGDISPNTLQGKLVAVLAMIFGIIYTAMPLAIVGSFFFDAYDKQKKATKKPDEISSSMRTSIPNHAAPAIEMFVEGTKDSENMSFKKITSKLKADVDNMLGVTVVKKKSGLSSMLGKLGGAKQEAAPTETPTASDAVSTTSSYVEAEPKVPEPNILPLVLKRMKRYVAHQQNMLLRMGRVIHYMLAEKQNGDLADDEFADPTVGNDVSLHHGFK